MAGLIPFIGEGFGEALTGAAVVAGTAAGFLYADHELEMEEEAEERDALNDPIDHLFDNSPKKRKRTGTVPMVTPSPKRVRRPPPQTIERTNDALGEPPGFSAIKKARFYSHAWSLQNSNTKYTLPLIKITYNADQTRRDTRPFNMVDVEGVHLNFHLWLEPPTSDAIEPYLFRWWIISNQETKKATGGVIDIPDTQFFTNPAPSAANGIGVDFAGETQPAIDLVTLKPNWRRWNVLKAGHKILSKTPSADRPMCNEFMLNEYIPLSTQMQFADNVAEYPDEGNVWFVYYLITMVKDNTLQTAAPRMKILFNHTTYHRNPKNYLT